MTDNQKWVERDLLPRAVMDTDDELELITPERLSELIKVDVDVLTQWRSRGTGPIFVKLGKRLVRYRRADILSWIEKSSRKGGGGNES